MTVRANLQPKDTPSQMPPDEFEFTLPHPPSANEYWLPLVIKGRARMGITNKARAYKKEVEAILKEVWPYHPYMRSESLSVEIVVFPANLRSDVHNAPKILLDSLEGAVMVNDISVRNSCVRFGAVSQTNPRVEIKIERMNV